MTSESKVYIAGVGFSPSPSGGSSAQGVVTSLVSAATKALLDAGVTYDDVSRSVRSKMSSHASQALEAFDERDITVNEAESESEFKTSFSLVRKRGAQCVLLITVEKSAAVALVLVSENFLWRHPYLRDSATLVREPDASRVKSDGPSGEGLYDVCKIVWALRGWSHPQGTAGRQAGLYYYGNSSNRVEISRADRKDIPKWKEVEHRQDGKHRLGYNPVSETKDISQEDFEAVRAIRKSSKQADHLVRFNRKGGNRAALARL